MTGKVKTDDTMARYRFTQIRLFVDTDLAEGTDVALGKDQTTYLITVMRLQTGAEILVFNGRDGEWTALLASASRKSAVLTIKDQLRPQTPAPRLTYCFAPLKHARLDYMVQKATEMGVGRLVPVLTQHSQVSRMNLDRMRANVIEACEQCGVLSVPEIVAPLPFIDFINRLDDLSADHIVLFCDEDAQHRSPLAVLNALQPGPVTLLVGPEGGFSRNERDALRARPSVVAVSLGPRILRADTAAVAALAVVQASIGDWDSDI
ncbi:MAG: 16S rRNA (uracil(1498)-N(3))-methyltransferase [Pseudomonadota bacterium]